MIRHYKHFIEAQLKEIQEAGLWKPERILSSPQVPEAKLQSGDEVLVLCANNYLGLADDPRVIAAARGALET